MPGFAGPERRDPIVPLLLSLACAVAFVAWSRDPGRAARQPIVIAWLAIVAGALLVAVPLVFFATAIDAVFPVGDVAMLEIYTLHASNGIWPLGPYSQFGWHHPGPLLFYLLAPLYLLSGDKTVSLHVGALAINLLSLCGLGYALMRFATPSVALAAVVALGVYLSGVESVITSYWNPHVVFLPAATFLVLCAALAAGRRGALPAAVFVGSFLVQTHVSLVPYVALLGSAALAAAVRSRTRTATSGRSLGWWMHASAWLLALLWSLPIVEQVSRTPGNLTRLVDFFGEPSPGQELRTALVVWGDTMCALFRRHLEIPSGFPLTIPDQSITIASLCAIGQLLLLAWAGLDAYRRQDRFDAALSAAGLLASVAALWSITRVKSLVGDYMVFWMSAIGTLNWALIAGRAATRVAPLLPRPVARWAAAGAAALVFAGFIDLGVDQLKRARRQGRLAPRGGAMAVKLATDAVAADMKRHGVRRPLFQMSTRGWGEAAGVVLQVYKRGGSPAVEARLVHLFGEPFAPTGQEDRVFVIADPGHAAPLRRPGDELIASGVGIAVYASTADR
jgi:hypothetical protein